MTTPFHEEFNNWLINAFNEDIPFNVKAFCFNLHYPADWEDVIIYGVELIGAASYDKTDDDWACYEVWEPKQRELFIPISFSTKNWETCQSKIKALIEECLCANNVLATQLKQYQAIAIGFVDGNLDLIWSKSLDVVAF